MQQPTSHDCDKADSFFSIGSFCSFWERTITPGWGMDLTLPTSDAPLVSHCPLLTHLELGLGQTVSLKKQTMSHNARLGRGTK